MNALGPRLINAGLRTSLPKVSRHPALLRPFHPAPLATRHFSSFGSSSRSRLLESFKRQASTFAGETSTAGTKWDYKRLAITGALVGGALFLTDGFLNRETRADGLSAGERSLLNSTFQHTGGGLLLAAITARGLFRSGFAVRMMSMNPWVVMGGGLVASIGSMMVCFNSSPDNKVVKYGSWALFNAAQGAALSPLYFLAPAVLGRAALYTLGTVGGLSYVGATAKNDQYLYIGGPLFAGLCVVALSSLAPMILPATAMRTLAVTESISLYGGLAVFSGFLLYDTQKILAHARAIEQGRGVPDPVAESISIELDAINIFVRLVTILSSGGGSRRK